MNIGSHENTNGKIISLLSFVALIVISLSFISAVPYLEGNKSVSPSTINVGESAVITLTVNGAGDSYTVSKPVDVMLVIDNSCSMTVTKLSDAKAAGNLIIDELIASDRAGMVSFNTNPTLRSQFTSNFSSVRSKINALTNCGSTNIGEAINLAINQFSGSNVRAMVLISDGRTNLPANAQAYALQKAIEAGSKNITIYTIGIGNDVDSNIMRSIATAGHGLYFHYPTGNALDGLFDGISQQTSYLAGTNISVTDVLAQGVFPSAIPSECNYTLNTRTVTCNAGSLNISESKSFSFDVIVYNSSLTHLNEIAYVNYTNYQNVNSSFILNNPNVTVSGGVNSCVGNIAPVLTIVSPVSGLYNNSLVSVSISASDVNLANVWYNLGGANVSYSGNFSVNLSTNIYRLSAYANDSCGSLSSTFVLFRVNTSSNSTNSIGPNVTIISPAYQTYNTSLILFNVTAVDDVAVSHVWCTLDNLSFTNCANSFSLNLSNGYHTFLAYANDSDGNEAWDGVTFLVNSSNDGNQTNPTNNTNVTDVTDTDCGNTHAPINDFENNDTSDSISMDDDYVVALNYVANNSVDSGFNLDSIVNGENNSLIFNMILLIAIIVLLLLIVLIGKRKTSS